MRKGAQLVDIRSDSQRTADGTIPGAAFVPRNVLEWRLDPACPHRDDQLTTGHGLLVLICDEGYQVEPCRRERAALRAAARHGRDRRLPGVARGGVASRAGRRDLDDGS